jgi:sec-independent protein translocase protein TatC
VDDQVKAPEEEPEQLAEGTLLSHLIELRSRIMKAMLTIAAVLVCLLPFNRKIFTLVARPLLEKLPEGTSMITTRPAGPFLTPFKTTLFVALFLAMPALLYQAWQFVAPGLYKREKRFAMPLLVTSIALFYAGVAFAYYVIFPIMFAFFSASAPEGVRVTPDISEYLDFVLTLFLAFGVAFEVPIATVLLIWSGLISVDRLRSTRPYVFLACFVLGMFLTPPDMISQTLLALPMYLLYESGIWMARFLLPDKTAPASEKQ